MFAVAVQKTHQEYIRALPVGRHYFGVFAIDWIVIHSFEKRMNEQVFLLQILAPAQIYIFTLYPGPKFTQPTFTHTPQLHNTKFTRDPNLHEPIFSRN